MGDEPLDKITGELVDGMPTPNPAAIEAEDQRASKWGNLLDKKGQPFDASIHRTHTDGSPLLSRGGRLVQRPGRKSQVGSVSTPEQTAQADRAKFAQIAALTVANEIAILTLLFGAGFAPHKSAELDEREALTEAWTVYYQAKGISEVKPEYLLLFVHAGYVLPRLAQPETRARMGGLLGGKGRIRKWWAKVRGRALSDSGGDGVGEDDIREERGGAVPEGPRPGSSLGPPFRPVGN